MEPDEATQAYPMAAPTDKPALREVWQKTSMSGGSGSDRLRRISRASFSAVEFQGRGPRAQLSDDARVGSLRMNSGAERSGGS